ncbi:MAG: NUDIX domain-containing protein [Anaerolineales bacterium]
MMKTLMRIWGMFPLWVHTLAARMLRPRFRVGVAALVFDEQGRVLLFKHTYRKFVWGIPVGGLEYGEQPEEGVKREFYEESGLTINVERLLFADSSKLFRHVTLMYLCKIIGGEFRESYEVSEMKYFDVNDLPRMIFDEKDLIRSVHKDIWSSP